MSFIDDLKRFQVKLNLRPRGVLAGVATAMHASIRGNGAPHPITGAPGQPVDTGFLRNSWTLEVRPTEAEISTNAAYARAIEDGIGPFGPLTLRSKVGGFHSVRLTIAGASAIQAAVLQELGP